MMARSPSTTVHLYTFHHPGTRRAQIPIAARLALHVHLPVDQFTIVRTGRGKPFVEPALGCHFSTSHTTGLSLLAITDRPLGIDIESLHHAAPLVEGDSLLRYLRPRDRRRINTAPAAFRQRLMLTIWTRIEALAKATGLGLSILDAPAMPNPRSWQFHAIPVPGYVAALAIHAHRVRLRWHTR